MEFSDKMLASYLRRSYQAADGLWFLMVEEAEGFQQALRLDESVWRVLAKIQARKARELLGIEGTTPHELARCFALKLTADGQEFTQTVTEREVQFTIGRCPWEQLLRNSAHRTVACEIAMTICPIEGKTWCVEFGDEYVFELPLAMCTDGEMCEMRFTRK